MIHTLLVGDFNAHSPTWSPKDWISQTGAMWWIEDWATTQGLQLLSAPGVPTHWGENGARDHQPGLVQLSHMEWRDLHLSISKLGRLLRFQSCSTAYSCTHHPQQVMPSPKYWVQGFATDILVSKWEDWSCILDSLIHPTSALNSWEDINEQIDLLYVTINLACKEVMHKWGSALGFNAKWWNEDFRILAKQVQEATSGNKKNALASDLKHLITTPKWQWVDEYISSSCVWEVAAWRHGHKSSHIPTLRDGQGVTHFDHHSMVSMLVEQFFAEGEPIPTNFSDDPHWLEPHINFTH